MAADDRRLATLGTSSNANVVFPRADHLPLVGIPDGQLALRTHSIPEYLETIIDWIHRRVETLR
jgi:hypothetical protein